MLQFDIDRMEECMSAREMTYKDLAEKTGISLRTIVRLRNNPEHFTSKTLEKISSFFKVSAKEFISESAGQQPTA